MAAETTQGRGRRSAPAEEETSAPTKRVILKQERVLILPATLTEEQSKALGAAMKEAKIPAGNVGEAWMVVSEQEGSNMDVAITAYTGPAGEPDTKVGTFKAPPARSWAGGLRMKAPAKPKVEKERIE